MKTEMVNRKHSFLSFDVLISILALTALLAVTALGGEEEGSVDASQNEEEAVEESGRTRLITERQPERDAMVRTIRR